ncbi:SWIM zinc finger family protein [Streptomyces sp. NPDC087844]|uniref:SWIM zinc finger family protein n=1 Tax=Streptomyces sp. NPDC087844 TaxID=3365805 RepID=UPI00380AD89C
MTGAPETGCDVTAAGLPDGVSGATGSGPPAGVSGATVTEPPDRGSDGGSDARVSGRPRAASGPSAIGRPDEVSEPPAADRPDVFSATSRPGDVAREALRAARIQADRERTAAQDKGVGASRKWREGAEVTAPGSRPTRSSREAAAQVRELAEMLGNSLDLSSRLEREERADESDTGPGTTRPATTPATTPATSTSTGTDAEASAGAGASASAGVDVDVDASVGTTTGADTEPVGSGAARTHPHAEPDAASDDTPAPAQRSAPATGRSMAAPARDGELRRTFPPPARARREGGFAETWWGNAWIAALEEMALDAARLGRGKAYAGEGHVDAVTVTPGLVLAYVHGSRPRPYRVQIRMRTLSDGDWERFLDAAAERPAHIAALLDKELPQALADSGVELLPGPGDLVPRCSCPDSGHPCKHAAALCYQTARLLDEDPFVLLLLRGRGERELLDELSRRNATLAARSARAAEEPALPGVPAREAVERRVPAPLPAPLPPPAHPEQPPAYPASPGGPDPFALDQLATDAAARAHALLTTGRDPLAGLTLWQDAVRIAATRPGSGLTATTRALYADLATAARRTPGDLARAVAAWRQGGLEGLAVLEEAWDPPAGRFDRARPLLLAADFPAFRPWHNHLTHPHGHIQLRLGHDGLWYAYESEPGHDDWWPRGTPDLDPVGALTGLGSPTDV